ncbi:unnamed protein product [Cuscuta europaea]|uniref:Uncharacterized protein n=1 Tax=Cuscuta europaea TaxID=41803 RepID=A0A9P0ZMY8_CUSEU|nr:unnamed protein product [Cuscuta europaea]
MWIRLCLVE